MLGLIVTLSGCMGTIPVWKCDTAKWAEIGARDGAHGLTKFKQFEYYTSQCGKETFKDALVDYNEGYSRGVLEYCTYVTGYKYGKTRSTGVHAYKNVCPKSVEPTFLLGYLSGIQTSLVNKTKQLKSARSLLWRAKTSLAGIQNSLPPSHMQEFLLRTDSEAFQSQYGIILEQEAMFAERVASSAAKVAEYEQEISALSIARQKWSDVVHEPMK